VRDVEKRNLIKENKKRIKEGESKMDFRENAKIKEKENFMVKKGKR